MITEILLVLFTIFIAIKIFNGPKRGEKEPPGPWGLPLLGHIPFLGKHAALTFMKWRETYGPMYSLRLGSIPTVVLNDSKLIKEAFSLQALSGRPPLINWTESSYQKGVIMPDGPRQVEQRRFAIRTLKDFGMGKSNLEFRLQEEVARFLEGLKRKCDAKTKKSILKIHHLFQYPVINSLWVAVMGDRFDEGDPIIGYLLKHIDKLTDMSQSILAQLSWYLPWLATALCHVGKNKVVTGWHTVQDTMEEIIKTKRADYVPGQPQHFTHAYFDQIAKTTDPHSSFFESRNEQKVATADIFTAAIDTTTVSMDWLMIHMVREPKVQQKLQQEIDLVIGRDNTPSLTHKPQMPYTEAVLQELLRISSIVPLGVFRRAFEDIEFHGYVIKKDTMVIANQFGAHRDPEVWEDPEKFDPERFLGDKGKEMASLLVPFGYGKRVCLGELFARDELFLFVTSFFQKFSISSVDPNQPPSTEGIFGIVMNPLPCEVVLSERTE